MGMGLEIGTGAGTGQGVRTVAGHGGITCVLQTQLSSFLCVYVLLLLFCCFLRRFMLHLGNCARQKNKKEF